MAHGHASAQPHRTMSDSDFAAGRSWSRSAAFAPAGALMVLLHEVIHWVHVTCMVEAAVILRHKAVLQQHR